MKIGAILIGILIGYYVNGVIETIQTMSRSHALQKQATEEIRKIDLFSLEINKKLLFNLNKFHELAIKIDSIKNK